MKLFYLREVNFPQMSWSEEDEEDTDQPSNPTLELSEPKGFEGFVFRFPDLLSYDHSRYNSRDYRRGLGKGMNYTNEALRQFIRLGGDLDILSERGYSVTSFSFGFETRDTDDGRASEGGFWYEAEDGHLNIWMGRVMTNSMFTDQERVATIRNWFQDLESRFGVVSTSV